MPRIPQETEKRISYEFRARLIAIIAVMDISKESFAEAANVNKEVITRATVYGIIPSVRSLIKIANFLNCSIPYLLGETDDKAFDMAKVPSNFPLVLGIKVMYLISFDDIEVRLVLNFSVN